MFRLYAEPGSNGYGLKCPASPQFLMRYTRLGQNGQWMYLLWLLYFLHAPVIFLGILLRTGNISALKYRGQINEITLFYRTVWTI